jgi:hypothetical protein
VGRMPLGVFVGHDERSPIKFVAEMRPGLVSVKMGLFPRIPAPEFETFVEHRHEWQGQHEGTTRYKVTLGGETV